MNTRREFLQGSAAGALAALGGASLPAPVRAAAPADTGSDIGSLYPFVKRQAVAGEFPLSFLQREFTDLRAWKQVARQKLLDLLHYAPPACDPRAELVERVDRGDHVQERVLFNTTPEIRVPAFVLVPKQAKQPAPGIVALHDHGGFYLWGKEKLAEFKGQLYGGRSIASELARAGYVVVVIDMFYWGERRMLLADDPPDWRERSASLTAERIAAFSLAALDDRIKAAVVVGWMTSFPAQLRSHVRNTIGFTKLVPGLYRHLDYPDVGSLAMPTPMLVINGSKDALFEPSGVRASFEKLAACYRKAGVPDRIETRLYDTPHEFNLEMQRVAWGFLEKHLGRSA